MTHTNQIQTLLRRKLYHLDSPDYDELYEHADETFLIGFTDQDSLQQLSKEIWKYKPNKRRLFQCFITFFKSPIYQGALERSNSAEFSTYHAILKKLQVLPQSTLVQMWAETILPAQLHCLLVIMKQAMLEKQLRQELVIMLLFRPRLMQDLVMLDKAAEYEATKSFLDQIEIDWFFGKITLSKTSMNEFYEALKKDDELYEFLVAAIKKELGLGRAATEEETFGYLDKVEIHQLAHAIVAEIKKEPKRAEYLAQKFSAFCDLHMPEDIKASLRANPISSAAIKVFMRG